MSTIVAAAIACLAFQSLELAGTAQVSEKEYIILKKGGREAGGAKGPLENLLKLIHSLSLHPVAHFNFIGSCST